LRGRIVARRASSAGVLGREVPIADGFAASVAKAPLGNVYAVAFISAKGGSIHSDVAEVNSSDQVKIIYDTGTRFLPAVSVNGFNDYILTYTSPDASDDTNIRGRRGHVS
jgi:hypothetical protein